MQKKLTTFFAAAADAQTITDLNIAAGIALEELEDEKPSPWPTRLRKTAATLAAVAAVTIVGDSFAASPVQAGISPVGPPHVFTHLGAKDWGDAPYANVFGHRLPWGAHDGWLSGLW